MTRRDPAKPSRLWRYSHSPVELIDLRDVVTLVNLIALVAEEW